MRIVVIGAGLLGISSAYFLSQSDNEIIVIDRRSGAGLETSFANGGMLHPSQSSPWNSPGILGNLIKWIGKEDSPFLLRPSALFTLPGWGMTFLRQSTQNNFENNQLKNVELARYSMQVLDELKKDTSIIFDNSERGALKLYRDQAEFNQGVSMSDSIQQAGIHLQVLNADDVVEKEPALSEIHNAIAGGIFFPDDESGDAYKYCLALTKLVKDNGVRFMYDTAVNNLRPKGKQIMMLDSSAGPIEGDIFIMAAGSYSSLLAKYIGLSLPIRPVKGYSITVTPQGWKVLPSIPVIDESQHIAITPLGSKIRISGTAELAGYNISITDKRTGNIYRFFREIYPKTIGGIDKECIEKWSGLRPYTSDGVPVLGHCRFDNLVLNTGHGHLGWTMAAGSGKLIADLIDHGNTALDIGPYSIDRFK